METNLDFKNWVPKKMFIIPFALGAVFAGLAFLHWAFIPLAVIFIFIGTYFAITHRMFSIRGKNIQGQVQDLILANLEWDGTGSILDIGCGNGPLSIKLARKYPAAKITAIDQWGKGWNYSIQECTANANIAGVGEQITFQRESASNLPFEDNNFDVVVSNLTFHEVKDVPDKLQAIHEAVRVLKPGGVFVLQDLFLLQPYFGTPETLINTVRGWDVHEVSFIPTHDAPFIPRAAKPAFMLGALAILKGKK